MKINLELNVIEKGVDSVVNEYIEMKKELMYLNGFFSRIKMDYRRYDLKISDLSNREVGDKWIRKFELEEKIFSIELDCRNKL